MERRTLRIPAYVAMLGAIVACSDQQTIEPGAIQLEPVQSQIAPSARGLAEHLVREQKGELVTVWEKALQGFAAKLSERAVEALRRNPHVSYVSTSTYGLRRRTMRRGDWTASTSGIAC